MRLSPKLRAALFFFDPPRPARELEELGQTLGLKPEFIKELAELHLVDIAGMGPAVVDPELNDPVVRYRAVHQFMNDTIVDALGLRSYLFVLKMERCSTLADLKGLAEAHKQAIAKATDPQRAEAIYQQVMRMVSL
jgi:hypothetical protein